MPNHTSFRLNRSGMLLALISAAFAGETAAATGGRVDFATPGATVAGTDGLQRPLAKGTEIGTGDTIRTDAAARAQIRFTDGSYISLQPNTEFAIKDYKFDGKTDGSESGIFGLAKGAMRTVTGLIGRVNRNKYQVTTPTATVGIRGTGGRIEVLLDGSTLIAGTSGIWVLSNPSGTLDIPAGTFGRAPSAPNQPPQRSAQGPNTGPAPLPVDPPKPLEPKGVEAKTDATCQTNPTGAACIASVTATPPIKPLVSGSGYTAAMAYTIPGTSPSPFLGSSGSVAAQFDAQGQLTSATGSGLGPNPGTFNILSGTHADFGTDGILAWGRWTGDVMLGCDCSPPNYGPNQGLHYVIGMPTAVMPTSGGGTYNMIGATRPTYTDGSTSPGTFSGSLVVDFLNPKITGDFKVAMPDRTYAWTATTTNVSSSFQLNNFSGVAGCAGACCSATANGFFAGASAERAGLAYQITDTKTVQGAAAFAR
jgi:hypothetical protein